MLEFVCCFSCDDMKIIRASIPDSAPSSDPAGPDVNRVLVVDDDTVRSRILARVLDGMSCEIRIAANAAECFWVIPSFNPHLLILDVVLPDLSGIEICRRLKAAPSLNPLTILLLSAVRTGSADRVEGLEAGADGYLAWPLPNTELRARIALALRHSRYMRVNSKTTAGEPIALTKREREVLFWIREGKRNSEIATILAISVRTVDKHVEHVMAKLGVETRTAAAQHPAGLDPKRREDNLH